MLGFGLFCALFWYFVQQTRLSVTFPYFQPLLTPYMAYTCYLAVPNYHILYPFDKLSVDEKLPTIFSSLTCNQDKVIQLERKMNTIIKVTQRMECMATVMNSYDDRLKLLEYKSVDNEARARRNIGRLVGCF